MRMFALVLTLSLGLAPWPAAAQTVAEAGGGGSHPASAPLLPGDMVRLDFWLDQELSGDYVVDEAGDVVLPLIGVRNATNGTPLALKRDLRSAYGGVLRNQDVQILLFRRVRVLGRVGKPGLYHAELGMTVGDVLAMAEGIVDAGDEDDVQLMRDGEVVLGGLSPWAPVGTSLRSGDQVYVPQRSWLSRNSNVVLGTAASITVALIYRGFFN